MHCNHSVLTEMCQIVNDMIVFRYLVYKFVNVSSGVPGPYGAIVVVIVFLLIIIIVIRVTAALIVTFLPTIIITIIIVIKV